MSYKKIDIGLAYKLIGSGPVICVCTKSEDNIYDIAPVAWHMPLDMNPFIFLLEVDDGHKTFKNIEKYKKFVIHIPNASQVDMINNTGNVSGHTVNKFEKFNIDSTKSSLFEFLIPKKGIGYIEAELIEIKEIAGIKVVAGKGMNAGIAENAFKNRILVENTEGKTLHHLGGKIFSCPESKIY